MLLLESVVSGVGPNHFVLETEVAIGLLFYPAENRILVLKGELWKFML